MSTDAPTFPKLLVLLVEDNEDDERFALRAIAKSEHDVRVVVAHNGREAIEFLGTEKPRLVLLDLKIPFLSGLEVLSMARQRRDLDAVPFVALSSSDEHSDVTGCYERGGNAYVRKPVDYNDYLLVIRRTLDFWLGPDQVQSSRA